MKSVSPLVSPAQLADLLSGDGATEGVVVCDVRFSLTDHDHGRRAYVEAHIPGARFVDLHDELSDQTATGRGRHPLPSTAAFAATLARLGVTPSTMVVAYDDVGGAFAARLWWMLRAVGHRAVAVLDGGIAAWQADGYPLTSDAPNVSDTVAYPVPTDWIGIVNADAVAAAAGADTTVVIDSRAPERYRGDVEPLDPRAGHIPGAINIFHGGNLAENGRHRSVAELAARFEAVGDQPIVYCGSGVTACHNLLAMHAAGIGGARLYPGSWSEWSSDADRPVATGDE